MIVRKSASAAWLELALWSVAFAGGDISGSIARGFFSPPPTLLFAVSFFVSLAGIAVILGWALAAVRALPARARDLIIVGYTGAMLGLFLGYVAVAIRL